METTILKDIVNTILNKNSNHGDLLNSSRDLAKFFEKYSSISTKSYHYALGADAKHTYLDSEIAISPLDSAICTNEYMRTSKYIRGVFEAINDLLLKFKNQKIHIFYAGCGPYATLIVPILSFFDPKRLEVTFLDIHRSSLHSVKSIVKGLHLEAFISGYIQDDATTYKSTKDIHMAITETMKAAFDDEPQVAISLNLLPQLHKKGIFIPQRIVVKFEAAHYRQILKDNMISKVKYLKYLCDAIDLDSSKLMTKENIVCTKKYVLHDTIDEKMDFQFITNIYIYKENILNENECSLNIPKKIKFDKKLSKNDSVNFDYKFGKKPKITFHTGLSTGWDNWIPQRVIYEKSMPQTQLIWYQMGNKRFDKPFVNL